MEWRLEEFREHTSVQLSRCAVPAAWRDFEAVSWVLDMDRGDEQREYDE